MTEQGEITITKEEAALVKALLGMWGAAYDSRNHRPDAAARSARRLKRPGTLTLRRSRRLKKR